MGQRNNKRQVSSTVAVGQPAQCCLLLGIAAVQLHKHKLRTHTEAAQARAPSGLCHARLLSCWNWCCSCWYSCWDGAACCCRASAATARRGCNCHYKSWDRSDLVRRARAAGMGSGQMLTPCTETVFQSVSAEGTQASKVTFANGYK